MFNYILISLILVPISLHLGTFSGKPVDLVYSDFLITIGVIYFLVVSARGIQVNRTEKELLRLSSLVFIFFVVLALAHILFRSGSISWLVSSFKFSKNFLAVYLAFYYFNASKIDLTEFLKISARVASVIVLIIFLSQVVFSGNFPSPRWGGYFLGLDVYGFPNSPAVYYVLLFSLVFSGLTNSDKSSSKLFYGITLLIVTMIIFFTLSRAAILTLFFFLLLILLGSAAIRVKVFILVVVSILLVGSLIYMDVLLNLLDTLILKFSRTLGGDQALSGRGSIWKSAIDLIYQKPLFGYGFESFSTYYIGHDTTHQQYLEVMYKAGLLGFCVYIFFYFRLYLHVKILSRIALSKVEQNFSNTVLIAFVSILISNLSQPTLNYSIAGNALVFYLAILSFYGARTERRAA